MNKKPGSNEGLYLGLTFGLIVVLGTIFFFKQWLPDLASDRKEIDQLFKVILVITGIAFILVQSITGYLVWRYSESKVEQAAYFHDHRTFEITWTLVTAIILCAIGAWGLGLWNRLVASPAAVNAAVVEVTGQQFQWNIRYPGSDKIFGRTDPKLISDDNPIGLDLTDKNSKDDIVTQDEFYLAVDQPVTVRLRAKDVIHSFFLPNFRVKQDAVPGMTIQTTFTPIKTGDYELACAQLCGLGHYKMRGILHVVSREEYENKLKALKIGFTPKRLSWKGD